MALQSGTGYEDFSSSFDVFTVMFARLSVKTIAPSRLWTPLPSVILRLLRRLTVYRGLRRTYYKRSFRVAIPIPSDPRSIKTCGVRGGSISPGAPRGNSYV